MRSEIRFNYESTGDSLQKWSSFRNFPDRVIEAIEKLDKWANSPGASSAMPAAYVSLKDWIGATAEKC